VSTAARQRIQVGSRTVLALSDGFFTMEGAHEFLGSPAQPEGGYEALKKIHGEVRMPVGCFLVPGDVTTLIDVGMGPQGDPNVLLGGNLLHQLHATGYEPDDIDVIAISHLHPDHTGWLATAAGEPVFPHARVVLGAGDWAYFIDEEHPGLPLAANTRTVLLSLAAQGRVDLLDDDRQIVPGITRLAAPGHTPGHSLYVIHDGADRALLFGDAMYCPQQLSNLDWAAASDVDPVAAKATRERYLRDLDAHGGVGVGCHFPELRAGRVLGGTWSPV
jgi:glyoxylase-like metal-dependent hydrolase (beta-lactamase superfamily II)